jgi:DNA-binding ferritin-like protein
MYSSYPGVNTAVAQPPAVQQQPPAATVEQQPPKTKPPAKAKTPGGDVGAFIQQLISLAAYVHQLQVQSHLIHFNYECSNFLGVHKFLGKQYEAHTEQFDKIGEFIRSMDYLLPMCHEGLMGTSPQFKHCTSYDPKSMLTTYYKNLEELGMMTKKLEPIAAKIGAIDIQNYMAELCGEAFKAAWFCKASLRNG